MTARRRLGAIEVLVVALAALAQPRTTEPARAPLTVVSLSRLPFSFESNVGQAPPQTAFVAHRGAATFAFSSTAMRAVLANGPVDLSFVGAAEVAGEGEGRLPGAAHYLIGSSPEAWVRDVPTWARIEFRNVYPGIHLVWRGESGRLEYDFIVEPGADPSVIRVRHSDGLRSSTPLVYQDGPVEGAAVARADGTTGFRVGPHDPARRLVIDPVLEFSTEHGGTGVDVGRAVAVDNSGNVFIAGVTASADFPVLGAFQPTFDGGFLDAFVSKISLSGPALVFSTYLGGRAADSASGVAVDLDGGAYVVGYTLSPDFPTRNAMLPSRIGGMDAFVTRFDHAGSGLVFSTYLGGTTDDAANAVAVDSRGGIYVAGQTASIDFPQSGGAQLNNAGALDAFVTKLSDVGFIGYSTFLGGSANDVAHGIAVDPTGAAYVIGDTDSTNFPTRTPFQAANNGLTDAFVAKLNVPGSAFLWASYLGSTGNDVGQGIAVDPGGSALVVGTAGAATSFPTVNPIQAFGGVTDVFVARIGIPGTALAYSTFLGGSGNDQGYAIAIDSLRTAYVTGTTRSTDFPTLGGPQTMLASASADDAFLTRLSPTPAITDSTYLGGTDGESGFGIGLTSSGLIVVAGETLSNDFPVRNPLQGPSGDDAFVAVFTRDGGALGAGGGAGGGTGGGSAGGSAGGGTAGGGTAGGGTAGGGTAGGGAAGGAGGGAAGSMGGGSAGGAAPVAGSYTVGCGCDSAPAALVFALLGVRWRRRMRSSSSLR